MSNFTAFLKKNKKIKENAKYKATKSLTDENGTPLEWELQPLTTKQSEKIREQCTVQKFVGGKPITSFDNPMYIAKCLCKSIVYPDLLDKDLQDSYGVKTPEDLLKELVDNPVEYNDLFQFLLDLSDASTTNINDKVEEAKN